jgi:hypothetical protein
MMDMLAFKSHKFKINSIMTAHRKFEYNVHSGNKDDYGDPLVGISRIETHESSLLIPRPLISLELTDTPKPLKIDGLIVPTQDEVRVLTGNKPRFDRANGTLSFIDVYGEGEQVDVSSITDTVAKFVLHALKNARNHNIHVYSDLSPIELDAIQAAEEEIRSVTAQEVDLPEASPGTGMYL